MWFWIILGLLVCFAVVFIFALLSREGSDDDH
jgi:hypothetical protein